jgi:uncharacterized protein YjbI with pentapeptide repeats
VELEQKPRGRASTFIKDLVLDWRPSRDQVLWTLRTVFVLVFLLSILTLIGLSFHVTLWNWLDLLIVPVVLAVGGFLFTRSENRATRAVAERRAQDEALQAYLDQMGQMLLDEARPLRQSKEDAEVRTLARAHTLTVLTRIDGERKRSVLQFLYESNLITKDRTVLDLNGANLRGANLAQASLAGASLAEASLAGADLGGVDLQGADLSNSDLRGAHMGVSLVHLRYFGVEITFAASRANLTSANLRGAYLDNADLSMADFTNATVTQEQLQQAASLEGAIMPNGQKYEDWLKDKEGRE